jgi:hypothetical protein
VAFVNWTVGLGATNNGYARSNDTIVEIFDDPASPCGR